MRRPSKRRRFVYDLANRTTSWGATTLLVGEYQRDEYSKFPEFAIADGIVRLGSRKEELTSIREIEVLKLRGADYISGLHFFDIGRDGLKVGGPQASCASMTALKAAL